MVIGNETVVAKSGAYSLSTIYDSMRECVTENKSRIFDYYAEDITHYIEKSNELFAFIINDAGATVVVTLACQ